MRLRFPNSRKLRKMLRHISAAVSDSVILTWIKPVSVIIFAMCVLLLLAPFLIGKFHSMPDKPPRMADETPPFRTAAVPDAIDVYRTKAGITETIVFEDYVKGVVSGEMPASFHEEALKAQAVAARTYSAARVFRGKESGNPTDHPEAPLCDSTHCQVYRSEEELEKLKGQEWMEESWPKICAAVNDTEGELIYYQGELVEQALFHSSSGGMTENAEDVFAAAVPYLVSVESPYEEEATHQNEENTFSIQELSSIFPTSYPSVSFGTITTSSLEILSRSSGGRVNEMKIGAASLTGRQVREALNLPSAKFDIHLSGDDVVFTSDGSGHGVGMSQYGADGMAKAGYNYKKILSHYYRGVEVW